MPVINWLHAGLGFVAGLLLAYAVGSAIIGIKEASFRHQLDAQKDSLEASCALDKKLTEENSHAYQKEIANINVELMRAKRLLPSKCVTPVAGKTAGGDGAYKTGQYAGFNGVDSDELLEYAGECERYRVQVNSLQDFINKVWDSK